MSRFGVPMTLVQQVATSGASLATGVVLARSLGPTDRGSVAAAIVWLTVLASLANAGTGPALCFSFAGRELTCDRFVAVVVPVLRSLSRALWVGAAAGIVAVALAIPGDYSVIVVGGCMAVGVVTLSFTQLVLGLLQAQSIARWNVARGLVSVQHLAVVLVLAAVGRLSIELVMVSFAAALTAQLLVTRSLLVVRGSCEPDEPGPRLETAEETKKYGRGWLNAAIPALLNERADVVLVALFRGARDAGIYAVATSLTLLAYPVAKAMMAAYFPRMVSSDDSARRAIETQAISFTMAGAALLAIPLVVVPGPLVIAIFGDEFKPATDVVRILAVGSLGLAANVVLADVLRARSLVRLPIRGEWIGVIGVCVLVPIAAERGSLVACAAASTAGYFATTMSHAFAMYRPSMAVGVR